MAMMEGEVREAQEKVVALQKPTAGARTQGSGRSQGGGRRRRNASSGGGGRGHEEAGGGRGGQGGDREGGGGNGCPGAAAKPATAVASWRASAHGQQARSRLQQARKARAGSRVATTRDCPRRAARAAPRSAHCCPRTQAEQAVRKVITEWSVARSAARWGGAAWGRTLDVEPRQPPQQ